jgi:hypothetical protein
VIEADYGFYATRTATSEAEKATDDRMTVCCSRAMPGIAPVLEVQIGRWLCSGDYGNLCGTPNRLGSL